MSTQISKTQFIYDFAMKTNRPASELQIFLSAIRESSGAGERTPKRSTNRIISYGHKIGNGMRLELTDEFENAKQFASQKDAAKFLGTAQSNVSKALAERRRINGWLITKVIEHPKLEESL